MTTPPPSTLARLEERRQSVSVGEIAFESEPIAGGTMSFAYPGAWANQASGMGFDGPVTKQDLDRLCVFYDERETDSEVEVAPYAHPSLGAGLVERGYRFSGFEGVFVLEARVWEPPVLVPAPDGRIRIERVDKRDPDAVTRYTDLVEPLHASTEDCSGARRELRSRCTTHERTASFIASIDGSPPSAPPCAPAGAGCVDIGFIADGVSVACLFGGATRPEFRGLGVQTALMRARVEACRDAGVDLVFVHSEPGLATERNALRLGFRLAYTKISMTRPKPDRG